jgi:hypothetical protein
VKHNPIANPVPIAVPIAFAALKITGTSYRFSAVWRPPRSA